MSGKQVRVLVSILFAAAVAILSVGQASAVEQIGPFAFAKNNPKAILLVGDIDSRTPDHFRKALARQPQAQVLVLASNGGLVSAAIKLANMVKSRGMSTAVPARWGCYSACVYVFFAGKDHIAKGKLGVHRMATKGGGADGAMVASSYYNAVKGDLARFGIPKGVIAKMQATSPNDMYVFSRKEIAALGINRGGANSLAAKYANH
jgi:hypothetical protein